MVARVGRGTCPPSQQPRHDRSQAVGRRGAAQGAAAGGAQAAAAQAAAAHQGAHKVSKLSEVGAKPWRNFLKNYMVACEINGWGLPRMKLELRGAMEGDAGELTRHIMPNHNDPAQTIEVFIAEFQACFITPANSDMAKTDFENARQSPSETVRQWSSRLRTTFLEAYPGADHIHSPHLLEKFNKGLHDQEVMGHVLRRRANTFPAAIEVAESETAAAAAIAQEKNKRSGKGIHSLGGHERDPSPSGGVHSFGRRGAATSKACYYCDQVGHLKRNCPLRQRDEGGVSKHRSDRGGGRGGGFRGRGGGFRGRGGGRGGRGGRGGNRRGGRPSYINCLDAFQNAAKDMVAMVNAMKSGESEGGDDGGDDGGDYGGADGCGEEENL